MIDWLALGFGALWIFGLGLELAALSLAYYQSVQQKIGFVQALEARVCRIMIDLGLAFFCLGRTGSVLAVWERIVWLVLGVLFAARAWQDIRMCKA